MEVLRNFPTIGDKKTLTSKAKGVDVIAMTKRTVQTRNAHLRVSRRPADTDLNLRGDDVIRHASIRAQWEDRDERWAVDPVFAFCVALLSHAASDCQRLQNAAESLLKARDRARPPLVRLEASVNRFQRALANTKNGVQWILDEVAVEPYAEVVGYTPEFMREKVLESLDANLAGIVTRTGPFTCPMCGLGRE